MKEFAEAAKGAKQVADALPAAQDVPQAQASGQPGHRILLENNDEDRGDLLHAKLVLAACYDYLHSPGEAAQTDNLQSLITWFHTKWPCGELSYAAVPRQFPFIFGNKYVITFIPFFNTKLLPGLPEADRERIIANATEGYLKTAPKAIKQFSAQLIHVIVNQLYTNALYADHQTRQQTILRFHAFINHLTTDKNLSFLQSGSNFIPYLQGLLRTLPVQKEHDDGLTDRIIYERTALKKWLEKYCEASIILIQHIPFYLQYQLQAIEIPSNFSTGELILRQSYMDLFNGTKKSHISIKRVQQIVTILQQVQAIIDKNFSGAGKISVTQLKQLVTQKKISLSDAGFYFDYVLYHPSTMPDIFTAHKEKSVYLLSADQYLRELLYDLDTWFTVKSGAERSLLELYVKPRFWESSGDAHRKEYGLALLKQDLLRPDQLLRAAADRNREGDKILSQRYLELTQRMLNPEFISFRDETEMLSHLEVWQPGIFQQASKHFIADYQKISYQQYFSRLMQLHHIRMELSSLYWHVRELLDIVEARGDIDTSVVYGEFLITLAKHTLNNSLATMQLALEAIESTSTTAVKQIFASQLDAYFPKKSDWKKKVIAYADYVSVEQWRHNGAKISLQPFYGDIHNALKQLMILCGNIEQYVTEEAVREKINRAEQQEQFYKKVTAAILGQKIPSVNRYLADALRFHQEQANRWKKILTRPADDKLATPPASPEKNSSAASPAPTNTPARDDKQDMAEDKKRGSLPNSPHKTPAPDTSPRKMTDAADAQTAAEIPLKAFASLLTADKVKVLQEALTVDEIAFNATNRSLMSLTPLEAQAAIAAFSQQTIDIIKGMPATVTLSGRTTYWRVAEIFLTLQKSLTPAHHADTTIKDILALISPLYSGDAKRQISPAHTQNIINQLKQLINECWEDISAATPAATMPSSASFSIPPAAADSATAGLAQTADTCADHKKSAQALPEHGIFARKWGSSLAKDDKAETTDILEEEDINTKLAKMASTDIFTLSNDDFLKYQEDSREIITDSHKLACVRTIIINLKNFIVKNIDIEEASLDTTARQTISKKNLRRFAAGLQLINELLSEDNIYLRVIDEFEPLKMQLTTIESDLDHAICAMEISSSPTPVIKWEAMKNTFSRLRELTLQKENFVSERLINRATSIIIKICDDYSLKHSLDEIEARAIESFKEKIISKKHFLYIAKKVKAQRHIRAIDSSKERIEVIERILPEQPLFDLFKRDILQAHGVINQLCLMQRIDSAYHLQKERAQLIVFMIIKIRATLPPVKMDASGKKMQDYIRYRLQEIFFSFTADCSFHPKRKTYLQGARIRLLKKYFGMNVTFQPQHTESSKKIYLLGSLDTPPRISEKSAELILFTLNRLEKIDTLIEKIPKISTAKEELVRIQGKIQQEIQFIRLTYEGDEIPPIIAPRISLSA